MDNPASENDSSTADVDLLLDNGSQEQPELAKGNQLPIINDAVSASESTSNILPDLLAEQAPEAANNGHHHDAPPESEPENGESDDSTAALSESEPLEKCSETDSAVDCNGVGGESSVEESVANESTKSVAVSSSVKEEENLSAIVSDPSAKIASLEADLAKARALIK